MRLVVMGVTGSGKTTVGKLLADRLGYDFVDADDFHPKQNIEKMRAGIPLNDTDRMPWLQTLRDVLADKNYFVMACSALKGSYRRILVEAGDVRFIYLKIDPDTVRLRLDGRREHFMNPTLIDSQFDTLEEPDGAMVIDGKSSPQTIVDSILERLEAGK